MAPLKNTVFAFGKHRAGIAIMAVAGFVYSRIQRFSVHIQQCLDFWASVGMGMNAVASCLIHGLAHRPAIHRGVLLKDRMAGVLHLDNDSFHLQKHKVTLAHRLPSPLCLSCRP